ncbi:MAG: GTPase HflX [Anaerolineales bacterium]|nr:GTPase HflX [Anaerolineales bacterium]MCB8959801.1 GTPase HflX [Ardenticatenales bacterium]
MSTKLHETKPLKERAYLVGAEFKRGEPLLPVQESLAELGRLADTAGLEVVGESYQYLSRPDPSTFIGSGKVQEIKDLAADADANVILFDDELLPRHQRELEKVFGEEVKVLDRTALILDIFAQHAQTHEGKLQVELAQLEYRRPRLTRMWTHLVRQAGGQAGGGVGVRGPGETQLEIDRREVDRRISYIREQLEQVREQRRRHRAKRRQTELQVVALVGYTNAGKSTLLNRVSGAHVLTADMLFATLDPTTRKVTVPGGREVLFTDTVGFIQKLPTQIVAAFRATLEEVEEADVLLHVVDATHPHAREHIEAVEDTLATLEADDLPMITALNKIDGLPEGYDPIAELGVPQPAVAVSAHTGEGIDQLLTAIEAITEKVMTQLKVVVPYSRGDLVAMFHERGLVEKVSHEQEGTRLEGRLPRRLVPYFEAYQYK